MDMIFREQITRRTLMVYIDNIVVHTRRNPGKTEAQHLERHRGLVREMLTILRKNDLFLNINKCQFEQTEVNYLGVCVGGQ